MITSPHDGFFSMTSDLSRTRPVAVITAFRAPADLAARALSLADQVEKVVIVDDGSQSLAALGLTDPRIDLLELPGNVGIAAALNRGIERAREFEATHIVTLDQDSALPAGYVAEAIEMLERLTAAGESPAAVVPARFGEFGAASTGSPDHPHDPIQSGQVLPVAVFDAIGGFEEPLFIDAVDTEFTLRARSAGYEFWILPESRLDHSLGEQNPIIVFDKHLSVFGKKRHHYYHAPFRTYYAMRNGLALWRLHPRGHFLWLARRTAGLFWASFLAVALSHDRRAQFRAVRHGFADGMKMRLGPIPERTLAAISGSQR